MGPCFALILMRQQFIKSGPEKVIQQVIVDDFEGVQLGCCLVLVSQLVFHNKNSKLMTQYFSHYLLVLLIRFLLKKVV